MFNCNRMKTPSWCTHVFICLLCATLIPHAAALEHEPYALGPIIEQQVEQQTRTLYNTPIQFWSLIGAFAATISDTLLGPLMGISDTLLGSLMGISDTLLGSLMGFSSMLWLIMRNDPAIDPRFAWMIFGAWSFFSLAYFLFQCHRVSNHRLYIFLSIALAATCLCIVALLQKSSLQNGLVTVIPPCTSFAAYSVAYFFPSGNYGPRVSEA